MVEQFVAAGIGVDGIYGFLRGFAGEQAFDVVGALLAFGEGGYLVHFVVAHKRALQAHRLGAAGLEEEKVAVFEQVFRAHLVEDGAAVDAALHGEGHAGGDVGLNQAGYHVHAGALGGHNQVHTGGAGFLRQAGDLCFHRLFLGHHQIG